MSRQERTDLNYPIFDGEKMVEAASIVIENGVITAVEECGAGKCVSKDQNSTCLLMPALIDAHTHLGNEEQLREMLKNGIAAACDVAAPAALVESAAPFTIISSAGMTMTTLDGKGYVEDAIRKGAKYIKVLLMQPNLMLKGVLRRICETAHEKGLKVAVHATEVKTVQLAVTCGADILLHVPLTEEYPQELAAEIAEKGIAVAPTLIMMETFANSGRFGYKPEHYQNARQAVKRLHENGATILAATDANPGSYAPGVAYGTSMHREMELLAQAGMMPAEILAGATGKTEEVFGITDFGRIKAGQRATLLLVDGRPDRTITDTVRISKMWIDGKLISVGNVQENAQ